VGVEKLTFHPKQPNWGDRKCLGDPTKSIVGHPDALLFLRISREGVFKQPRTHERAMFVRVAVAIDFQCPWNCPWQDRLCKSVTSIRCCTAQLRCWHFPSSDSSTFSGRPTGWPRNSYLLKNFAEVCERSRADGRKNPRTARVEKTMRGWKVENQWEA